MELPNAAGPTRITRLPLQGMQLTAILDFWRVQNVGFFDFRWPGPVAEIAECFGFAKFRKSLRLPLLLGFAES